MLRRLSDWLRRASTGWVALFALVLFALFLVVVLPRQARLAQPATEGAGTPDTSFFYSPSDLYRMAAAYGLQGRQAYVEARATFDVVWPLAYCFFLTAAIAWFFGLALAPDSRWHLANLVPLTAALFDLLENVATSVVMIRYPTPTPGLDQLAPVFTLVKWLLLVLAFGLLLAGMALVLWSVLRRAKAFSRPENE